AFRLLRDVFGRGQVDLLFEEAAVNDSTNFRSPQQITRGMEGILRHARQENPKIDIVVMHFVDPSKMDDYRAGETPVVIGQHEAAAEHYDVPTIHLAREVTERIDAGQFTWEDDFLDLHPSPYGQQLYAATIRRMLAAAWSRPLASDAEAAPGPMPAEPLDPFSYDAARLVPVGEAAELAGFSEIERCDPRDPAGGGVREGFVDVPMLVGTKPKDEFSLKFTGRAVGLFVAAGPDAGIVEFRIDEGPWRSQDLFTAWSQSLHLPWAYVLEDELDGKAHSLTVRISENQNEKSRGHACRVVHFLVNE
ncbi:MAG: SGNH/GDSL hydrolase family protein, partial [Planctomycetota bacterium]